MPSKVFTTFAEVQNALQTFVTTNNITIPNQYHKRFWEIGANPDEQYTNFVTGDAIQGFPILQKGNGANSNIIKALSGTAPFDGSTFNQMPIGGPFLDLETIDAISAWIDAGANQ
jgi:hypothetical protein